MEDEALRKGILLMIPLILLALLVILFRDWLLTILLTTWMNFELRKITRIISIQLWIQKKQLDS